MNRYDIFRPEEISKSPDGQWLKWSDFIQGEIIRYDVFRSEEITKRDDGDWIMWEDVKHLNS